MAITRESIIKRNSLPFRDAVTKASKVALDSISRDITLYVLAYKTEEPKVQEMCLLELTNKLVDKYIEYINFYANKQDPDLTLFNDNILDYKPRMIQEQKEILWNLINNVWEGK